MRSTTRGLPLSRMLKELRERRGLSQKDLAVVLRGLTGREELQRGEVSRWERGVRVPKARWLGWLAVALDTPVAELEAAQARTRRFYGLDQAGFAVLVKRGALGQQPAARDRANDPQAANNAPRQRVEDRLSGTREVPARWVGQDLAGLVTAVAAARDEMRWLRRAMQTLLDHHGVRVHSDDEPDQAPGTTDDQSGQADRGANHDHRRRHRPAQLPAPVAGQVADWATPTFGDARAACGRDMPGHVQGSPHPAADAELAGEVNTHVPEEQAGVQEVP